MYSLTKEQLRQLTDPKIKEWFPEVFEVKLEVGEWYKNNDNIYKESIACVVKLHGDGCQFSGYGFDRNGNYIFNIEDPQVWGSFNWIKATEQEVFETLKNEAIKRGFIEWAYVKTARGMVKQISGIFHFDGELSTFSGSDGCMSSIFLDGKWAEIIQTITKSEAEKLLNKKIID